MKTEGKNQVNGRAEHTAAWGLFGICDCAKILKIQKASKKVRKGLARATEV